MAAATFKNLPAWLISAIFHMLVLIVLGLAAMSIRGHGGINLDFQPVYAEQLGDQLEFDSRLGTDQTDQIEEPIVSISDLVEVPDPLASPEQYDLTPNGFAASSDIETPNIGLALLGREAGAKESLLGRYGGNAVTQAAVQRGLAWLARFQITRNDRANGWEAGSWSLRGPYSNGVDQDNTVAATAMALLAFQGDGNTHQKGEYRQNVARAWKWLLTQQDEKGSFFHTGGFNHAFYSQALCTIAVCELYGMTKDPEYREPAERAVKYCLDSQSPLGGWKYVARSNSDVSVTGWIVMALQSARMAGLDVPQDNLDRVTAYLDSVGRENGSRYPYERDGDIRVSMTAEAMLCRQYLGWKRDDPRLVAGADWITSPEHLIDYDHNRDVYTWYYTTQVAHHMEGDVWKRWNEVMRQVVPEHQITAGSESGSWDPARPAVDAHGFEGGRLYVTCLSLYMLEVYYRHLPIYSKIYSDLLRSGRTDQP